MEILIKYRKIKCQVTAEGRLNQNIEKCIYYGLHSQSIHNKTRDD